MKQVKYLLLFMAMAVPALRADPDTDRPTPSPTLVQARVFRNLKLQDFKLEGDLHTLKKRYPLELQTRDREMLYLFKDQPLQVRVVLDPAGASVARRGGPNEAWKPVTGVALKEKLLNTDVAYEDIGLSFIFWDQIRGIGTDSIKTLPAWCFEAVPPAATPSLYTKVRYWISSEYYAFLRVDGYDAQDRIIKRVEVNGVQQIGEAYVIKEMEIETMVPGTEISASRTYIDVASGTPGSGLVAAPR